MLSTNTLLSGNNFRKIQLLLRFLNIGCVTATFHDEVQSLYAVPNIESYYTELINSVLVNLKDRRLVLSGMKTPTFIIID